jgi:excisionase family DNA binding protein
MSQKKSKSVVHPSLNSSLPDPFFVGIREAARRLGFTVWKMRCLCWAKEIRFVRQGKRKFLFSPRDLQAYAEKLLNESAVL